MQLPTTTQPLAIRSYRARRLVGALLAATILSTLAAPPAMAASKESKIKVAYLYVLLRNTTWPGNAFASDDAPYVIGVLGDDPLGSPLDKLAAKKTVNKRKIVIERFAAMDGYKPCHILYASGELDEAQRGAILGAVKGKPVLVIGDAPGFAAGGATANFYVKPDEAIGFEINAAAAGAAKLQLKDAILKAGKAVP